MIKQRQEQELRKLLEEKKLCDAVLYTARCISEKGSRETVRQAADFLLEREGLGDEEKSKIREIAGSAHALMLDLETAKQYYDASGSEERRSELANVAIWYGKYPKVAKELAGRSDGYYELLQRRALLHLSMGRDEQGFYLDEDSLAFVMEEMQRGRLNGARCLESAVAGMEQGGNLNIPKRVLLAQRTGNQEMVDRTTKAFMEKAKTTRRNIEQVVQQYCAVRGMAYKRRIQEGDYDVFFPVASHIFLVERDGRRDVFKEHLKLYVDFSRLDGYNQEKEILEAVDHDGIVKYLGSFELEGHEFLKFEHFNGDELSVHTRPDNLLPPNETARVIGSVAETLQYLHDKGVIYMDVKAKNVLYNGKEAKLLDFGMARKGEESPRSLVSTPAYIPPEMAARFTSTKKSDTFQLGILFYEMMTGQHPFAGHDFIEGDEYRESEIIKYAVANRWNNAAEHEVFGKNPGYFRLIKRMLDKDPARRPTVGEVAQYLSVGVIAG